MRELLPQIPQLGGINPSLSAGEKFPPPLPALMDILDPYQNSIDSLM